jgi:signal transduction histidine kinase
MRHAAAQSCLLLLRKRHCVGTEDSLLEEGLGSVRRGKALTERLLGFARQQPPTVRQVDLGAAMRAMDMILRRALGPGIRLRYELEKGLPTLRADQNELELALLNLVINASDAMPAGGTLTLRARRLANGAQQPPAILLEVVDTGIGMSPEVLARAREPFFTTKADGQGTGLGLGMVDSLARQLGGALHITSEPGRGTTVSLVLPGTGRPVRRRATASLQASPPAG